MSTTSAASRFRFGPFTFDRPTGELAGPDRTVRLPPQPALVLSLLLEANGEMVSRDLLRERVWPDTTVEFDQGLNFCIRQVRAALGDEASTPQFIETLPRRGYRFLVPVETEAPTEPVRRRGWMPVAAVGLLGLLGAVYVTRPEPVAPVAPAVRIVIMPFRSPDSAETAMAVNAEFVEGIIAALTETGAGRYAIVGPAGTAALRARGQSALEVGATLNGDFAMAGGITADTARIFVQVLRVGDGGHVYARRFATDTIALPDVQTAVVRDVARLLSEAERARP